MSVKIDSTRIPNHLAIILDGNGRWAKERGMPREFGHKRGFKNLLNVAKHCNELGVKCLTVYAFSTENWNRPKEEVDFLMSIPSLFVKERFGSLDNTDVVINFIGRKDRFPKETLESINQIMEKTKDNKGMKLNIAFDYGSKNELVTAFKSVASKVLDGSIKLNDINEEIIENNLFTKDDPKLDLLIRTSGEVRISNFLLWQLSYAELYFTEKYWPEFNKNELFKAIKDYQKRNRRFGGLK